MELLEEKECIENWVGLMASRGVISLSYFSGER